MKKLILLFSLLISCSNSEPEINYETFTIDEYKASKLIDLSIDLFKILLFDVNTKIFE